MNFHEIKNKIHSLNNAWEEFKSKNDQRLSELEQKGSSDPMLQQTLHRINDSIEQTSRKIEMLEIKRKRPNLNSYQMNCQDREYKKAFNDFLRFGESEKLRHLQTKAASFTYDNLGNSGSSGGYLIRPAMSEYIDLYSQDSQPLFELVSKDYSIHNKVNFITDDDNFKAQWNKDGTDITGAQENSVTFSQNQIKKSMLFCKIKVNANIINDPIVDLEKYIIDVAARAFAKARTAGILFGGLSNINSDGWDDKTPPTEAIATKLGLSITADNINKNTDSKKDILVAAIKKAVADAEKYGADNGLNGISKDFQAGLNVTANIQSTTDFADRLPMLIESMLKKDGTASDITYQMILNLYHKLDARYLKNAAFVMSSNTLSAVRGLKSGDNYLWAPANANFAQDTILGAPVYRVNEVDAITNKTAADAYKQIFVYFGDFKRAYYLALNPDIEIVRDPFSNQPSVNFLISQYTGGTVIDKKAIAALGNVHKT